MRHEWPNNEAEMTVNQYYGLVEDEGIEYANMWLERQREHMSGVFGDDEDIRVYTARVDQLIGAA